MAAINVIKIIFPILFFCLRKPIKVLQVTSESEFITLQIKLFPCRMIENVSQNKQEGFFIDTLTNYSPAPINAGPVQNHRAP